MDDLTALGLGAAAAGLGRGDFAARELTEAYLRRIDSVDSRLNAFVTVTAELALAQADASDRRRDRLGPLDGVPIALKDNIDVEGVPTTNGLGCQAARVAARDAAVVERLRAAGVVLLGKLNMDEGALGAATDNPHHGRANNPWRHGLTPGGSSGGAGAAVAARLAVAAVGTDTMGSVRLPAAYCGVVGLKPSHGLLSCRGIAPLCPRLDDVGLLTRTVRDLHPLLSTLSQRSDFMDDRFSHELAQLRLGALACERILEPEVVAGFERALSLFREIGVAIDLVPVPHDLSSPRRAGLLLCEADAARAVEAELARAPDAFSARFRAMLRYGQDVSTARVTEAERRVRQSGEDLRRLLERFDLLVAPTAPQTAFPFDHPAPVDQADLTAPASFAGCPAISLPCGIAPSGLPLAAQLVARRGHERTLLALAAAFEDAAGYRLPDLPTRA